MNERRRDERRQTSAPVFVASVDRNDRAGNLRDVSQRGALFTGRSRFELGERISVRFPSAARVVAGRVVRVGLDADDDTLFQYVTAVRFDLPLETLPA
jgi:hypothetical protein